MIKLESPLIDSAQLAQIKAVKESGFQSVHCQLHFLYPTLRQSTKNHSKKDLMTFASADKAIENGDNLLYSPIVMFQKTKRRFQHYWRCLDITTLSVKELVPRFL